MPLHLSDMRGGIVTLDFLNRVTVSTMTRIYVIHKTKQKGEYDGL